MADKIPSIPWIAVHIGGPVAEPTATMEAWYLAQSRCSRCHVLFTEDQTTRTVCAVPDVDIFMFCPDCSETFKAHGFLNIPNILWLEISLKTT